MSTIFMISENSKNSPPHSLALRLTKKMDLTRGDARVVLSNLNISYTWKNMKKSNKNIKFKISIPTWDEELELPDSYYSVSDIQNYFDYIIKKHKTLTEYLLIGVCINRIENRITFKIKTGYHLAPSTPQPMKLHCINEKRLTKDKNSQNVS